MPATVNARVPAVVTGEPETEINPPVKLWATLVTVPPPAGVAHVPSPRKKLEADGVPVTGFAAIFVPVLMIVPLTGMVTFVVPVTVTVRGNAPA